MVEIGKAPAEATFVIFEDVPKENWAQAGTLASDESQIHHLNRTKELLRS